MAVMRWDPWGELALLQRDVNSLLGRQSATARGNGLVPPMDAYRTDEGLVVTLELPGLRPDDVEVSVNEGMLTVAGERTVDANVAEDAWVRRERPVGRFERTFSLPEGTDASAVTASFDAGLLELHIPHPPQRRPHKVEISSGRASEQTVDVTA